MKNTKKGFIIPLIIIIIAVLAIGGGVYIHSKNEVKNGVESSESNTSLNTQINTNSNNLNSTTTNSISANTDITFSVTDNNLSVLNNGKVTQTLSLDDQGIFAVNLNPSHSVDAFITDKDVNFDGHNDVAVLTSTGYAGVNYFYDYYIYNPNTGKLEKSSVLTQLSNPKFDLANKKINSTYRDGPQWYSVTFQWNGSTYIKSNAVAL